MKFKILLRFVVIVVLAALGAAFSGVCSVGGAVAASGHVWKTSDGIKGIAYNAGNADEKRRVIEKYLVGKYENVFTTRERPEALSDRIKIDFDKEGYIRKIDLFGTIPGFKMSGKTDNDLRAAALAFLNEEKELFALNNARDDLKEVLFTANSWSGRGVGSMDVEPNIPASIEYRRHVDGIFVFPGRFRVDVYVDGAVSSVSAEFANVIPDMLAAVKKFKTKGITKEKALKIVMSADRKLLKRFGQKKPATVPSPTMELRLIEKAPYVAWAAFYRSYRYDIDAFTGEVLRAFSVGRMPIGNAIPKNVSEWLPAYGMKGIARKNSEDWKVTKWKADFEKRRIIEKYLKGKYRMDVAAYPMGANGVSVEMAEDGSISKALLIGEMKVPGFKMKGNTGDDYRAAALAFLDEEKELLGLTNACDDLIDSWSDGLFFPEIPEIIDIYYFRHVEGIKVASCGSKNFYPCKFTLSMGRDGTIKRVEWEKVEITPEMHGAAKRLKTGGKALKEIMDVIIADYEEKRKSLESERFQIEFNVKGLYIIREAPYAVFVVEHRNLIYVVDAFTGKMLDVNKMY